MKILYREADLFSTDVTHIIHGCNAQGVMGSGVAGILRQKHPEVYEAYREAYVANGNTLELGDIVWANTADEENLWGNMITQDHYGRDPTTLYVSYSAIEVGMMRLDSFMQSLRICLAYGDRAFDCVAMPAIGCGLANGDWRIVSEIIERRSRNFQPVVYYRKEDGHPLETKTAKG